MIHLQIFTDVEQGEQEISEERKAAGEHQEGSQEEEEGQDCRKFQLLCLAPHPRPADVRGKTFQETRPAQGEV